MSSVPMSTITADRQPGSHRGPRRATGTTTSASVSDAGKHRAKAQRTGGRRALATATIAAGLVAGPALTSPASAHPSYTVQSGDTLSSIAQRYDTTWRELYRANRDVISSPTTIYPGQSIKTSGSSSGSSAARDTSGSCTNGTSVPSGVSPNIVSVHQAVCAGWPSITGYGTFRSDGEHAQGLAIDVMVSGQTGWDVAEYLRANAGSLGISYLIYSQKIWSTDRAGEGWRGMEDRGSTTANHYDHVHVTTY